MAEARETARPQISPINDPRWRSAIVQILLCLAIAWLAYGAITNAADNLTRARVATGFDFWNSTAGFDISQTLIPYTTQSTYGRAFLVGLLNTLLVASLGIVFATIIGFTIGILQLSKNALVSRLAAGYVEIIRNLPLLLQLLFWYNAVLKALPNFRESLMMPGGAVLNNRGLYLPKPIFGGLMDVVLAAFCLGVIGTIAFRYWARRRQASTGQRSPVFIVSLLLIIVMPVVVFAAMGFPVTFEMPEANRYNISGGIEIQPELAALLFGLSIYTAAFIAEVVRAGVQAVSHGQTEAAYSLGLRPGPTLRLVVIPQAMRVIVPPLTNQYLNLTKNSTLAVAIGYPDLVQVFTGTVLNQTGQAVEVVAITMAVYLTISLVTSGLMNLYNRRFALKER